jgi:hypothetical protein
MIAAGFPEGIEVGFAINGARAVSARRCTAIVLSRMVVDE